jgi:serine/threonine-protein kinase
MADGSDNDGRRVYDPDQDKTEVGVLIGARYLLERCIGRGGNGEVFSARDIRTADEVAVKVLKPGLEHKKSAVGRFERETSIVQRLQHANVVAVHSVGKHAGGLYLAMELLHGETLAERLVRTGPMPAPEAAHVFIGVARGLAEAHRLGIVHRDLKLSNIFLHEGPNGMQPKLLDFGLAKLFHNAEISTVSAVFETRTGMLAGTLRYVAPEQILDDPVDGRTDLYALGIAMYRMVSGEFPFVATSPPKLLQMHLAEQPPLLPDDVPLPVAALVMQMLEKKPDERPADANEVMERLSQWLDTQGPLQTSPPLVPELEPDNTTQEEPHATEPGPSRPPAPVVDDPTPADVAERGGTSIAVLVGCGAAGAVVGFGTVVIAVVIAALWMNL